MPSPATFNGKYIEKEKRLDLIVNQVKLFHVHVSEEKFVYLLKMHLLYF